MRTEEAIAMTATIGTKSTVDKLTVLRIQRQLLPATSSINAAVLIQWDAKGTLGDDEGNNLGTAMKLVISKKSSVI